METENPNLIPIIIGGEPVYDPFGQMIFQPACSSKGCLLPPTFRVDKSAYPRRVKIEDGVSNSTWIHPRIRLKKCDYHYQIEQFLLGKREIGRDS